VAEQADAARLLLREPQDLPEDAYNEGT